MCDEDQDDQNIAYQTSCCVTVIKTVNNRDGDFLRPVFAASRVQRISDLHSKFALRPHHVPKYGKHPISDR